MKLHLDQSNALNTVTAYGAGYVEINRQRHGHAVVFSPEGEVRPWGIASIDELTAGHFAALAELRPELVLVGTGARQRLLHPRLTAALSARRIGVDLMDTGAACRTYNILMSEGRGVLAALLLP